MFRGKSKKTHFEVHIVYTLWNMDYTFMLDSIYGLCHSQHAHVTFRKQFDELRPIAINYMKTLFALITVFSRFLVVNVNDIRKMND